MSLGRQITYVIGGTDKILLIWKQMKYCALDRQIKYVIKETDKILCIR